MLGINFYDFCSVKKQFTKYDNFGSDDVHTNVEYAFRISNGKE